MSSSLLRYPLPSDQKGCSPFGIPPCHRISLSLESQWQRETIFLEVMQARSSMRIQAFSLPKISDLVKWQLFQDLRAEIVCIFSPLFRFFAVWWRNTSEFLVTFCSAKSNQLFVKRSFRRRENPHAECASPCSNKLYHNLRPCRPCSPLCAVLWHG